MLVRIISAAVALPLFIAIIFFLPSIALTAACSVFMLVGAHELLSGTGAVKNKLAIGSAMVCAAGVPWWMHYGCIPEILLGAVFAEVLILFGIRMARGDFGFDRISMSLFGAFIMPVLFSLLVLLRAGEDWSRVVLLPFIVAWASDTGAYFAGSFFGKHKLCPTLSPKKTVEGALGGLLLAAVGGVVYGLIVGKADLIVLAVIGLLGSAVGQFGDLMFSCIKREYGIKDYGKLMPGHGGVLDRFDSSVVTIPLVWLILRIVSL